MSPILRDNKFDLLVLSSENLIKNYFKDYKYL